MIFHYNFVNFSGAGGKLPGILIILMPRSLYSQGTENIFWNSAENPGLKEWEHLFQTFSNEHRLTFSSSHARNEREVLDAATGLEAAFALAPRLDDADPAAEARAKESEARLAALEPLTTEVPREEISIILIFVEFQFWISEILSDWSIHLKIQTFWCRHRLQIWLLLEDAAKFWKHCGEKEDGYTFICSIFHSVAFCQRYFSVIRKLNLPRASPGSVFFSIFDSWACPILAP